MSKLATKAALPVLDKFKKKKKISRQGVIVTSGVGSMRPGKGFPLFISNEDMDYINKIVESLEKSGLLIDCATETVKHEIKKQKGALVRAITTPMAASLVAPNLRYNLWLLYWLMLYLEKESWEQKKRQEGGTLLLLTLPLRMNVLEKRVTGARNEYNNRDQMDKSFFPIHSLGNRKITKYFNYEPRFNGLRDS